MGKVVLEPERVVDLLDELTKLRRRLASAARKHDAETLLEAPHSLEEWEWSKLKKAGVAISVPEEGVIALHLAPGVNPDLDGLLGKVAWALSRLMADEASDPAPEAEPESGGKEGGRWFDG